MPQQPGYNVDTVNDQMIPTFNQSTPQVAQGTSNNVLPGLYNSSYATPSSYAVPSSIDVPNPYYAQQGQSGMGNDQAQMVKLLRGG